MAILSIAFMFYLLFPKPTGWMNRSADAATVGWRAVEGL